jgi:ABC-type phosphate/phosphonate transport system substrate-binding protein
MREWLIIGRSDLYLVELPIGLSARLPAAPLPPESFDPALAKRIQQILLEITEAQAKTILPNHYTGFVAATHESYKTIEDAGVLVGRIKKK